MNRWLLIAAIVVLMGAGAVGRGICEEDKPDVFKLFRPSPMQSAEDELFIIQAKCKQYGLTELDAEIIEAMRKFYTGSISKSSFAISLIVSTFQADVDIMIDWACLHFTYIHNEYEILEPKPDYIDFVASYFWEVANKSYNLGLEKDKFQQMAPLVDFIRGYIKANYGGLEYKK